MKIKEKLASVKLALNFLKPCIKGVIMVLIGIINSRTGIGIGRLSSNALFGVIGYSLIALSGLFIIQTIKMRNSTINLESPVKIRSDILFGILGFSGIVIVIIYSLQNNIGFLPILVSAIIVIIMDLFAVLAIKKKQYGNLIRTILIILIFTFGIIFGASLNSVILFLPIWLFFLAAILLQIPREAMKGTNQFEEWAERATPKSNKDVQKLALIHNLISIPILMIALFSGLINPIMYLYCLLIEVLLLTIIIFKMWKQEVDEIGYKKINKLLKYAILFGMLAFLMAGL